MDKRGIGWIFLVIIILISIVIILSVLVWLAISEGTEIGEGKINETESETLIEELNNESLGEQENGNNTENNVPENQSQEDEEIDNSVPNPSGEIRWMNKEESFGGYYCDNNTSPKHGIKVYTYRTIGGNRTLSEDYIESGEIEDTCKYYDEDYLSTGINYYIEWKWTAVGGIGGYKIYQYYDSGNITRNYDYFILLPSNAERLLDTELNLWEKEN